jgi:hypothetical protein
MPSFSDLLRSAGLRQLGLIAGGLMAACPAAWATSYTYVSIVQPGAKATIPVGLNASGEVVGYWYDSNYAAHPFVYQNGAITPFSFPEGVDGISITGINDAGAICGGYADSNDASHGFIYTAKGKLTTIDVPGGTDTFVNAMNNEGEVAGSAFVNGYGVAFVYRKGVYTVISPATPETYFIPQAINGHGSVAGYQESEFGTETGFTYIAGVYTLLSLPDTYFTAAFSINVHNAAAGQLANDARQEYGFTYSQTGTEAIIGPSGSTDTFSLGINDAGVVTGVSYDTSGNSVGYTYKKNGKYSTLSFGGYSGFSGNYINASGQVLGEYIDNNNIPQIFLATPKP